MEPLLSVAWLWPDGWSLALRSRRSGPDPWREMERLWPGAHPHPPHPRAPAVPSGTCWGVAGLGDVVVGLCQGSSGGGGRQRRELLALGAQRRSGPAWTGASLPAGLRGLRGNADCWPLCGGLGTVTRSCPVHAEMMGVGPGTRSVCELRAPPSWRDPQAGRPQTSPLSTGVAR